MRNFTLNGKKNSLSIQQYKSGKYITPYDTFELRLHGLPFKIESIEIDNEEIALSELNPNQNTLIVSKEFTVLRINGK